MGGTIRGKIECYHYQPSGGDNYRIMQEVFKNLFDFFTAHPTKYTIVASHYGGGGTDYWDGANPFGDKSWFVVKFAPSSGRSYPWYLLVQLVSMSTNVNTGTSAPCLIYASGTNYSYHRLGLAAAVGVGGDENPWNGTMKADGTDSKGDPVWKVPSGGTLVHVLDRSCAPGGSYETKRENMMGFELASSTPRSCRYQIVADDDCFSITTDIWQSSTTHTTIFFGPYTLRSGLSNDYPMLGIGLQSSYSGQYSNTYGQPYGSSTRPGGIIPAVGGSPTAVKSFFLDWFDYTAASTDQHPNKQFATPAYDLFPFLLGVKDNPYFGMVGFLDWIKLLYNAPAYDTSSDQKLAFFGSATTADKKIAIPWDGVTTPGSGTTRQGVDF